jgi:hypothetical protein
MHPAAVCAEIVSLCSDRHEVTVHASAEALSDNAVLDPDDPPLKGALSDIPF